MNRNMVMITALGWHLPHTCGDEPTGKRRQVGLPQIYPTHVGMNRYQHHKGIDNFDLPHTCGDEPHPLLLRNCIQLSTPHMWG